MLALWHASGVESVGQVLHIYPYQARWGTIVGTTGFFGLCAAVLTPKLFSEHVAPGEWVGVLASWGFVSMGLLLAVARVVRPKQLLVGSRAIAIPGALWSGNAQVIALDSIVQVERQRVSSQHFLKVHHAGGSCTISASMLPSREDLDAIADYLASGSSTPSTPAPGALSVAVESRRAVPITQGMSVDMAPSWAIFVLKIVALLSFCGGPLYLADLLKPELGGGVSFGIAFAPLVLIIFGTFSVVDDEPSTLSRLIVRLGGLGSLVVLCESGYATWRILGGEENDNAGLILFGSAVSCLAVGLYAWFARRYLVAGH